jgi:hypothetical protein
MHACISNTVAENADERLIHFLFLSHAASVS